jgi:hypothetical protein
MKAKDLILRLLKKEPSERIGANNMNDLKEHPFFSETIVWESVRKINVPINRPAKLRPTKSCTSQNDLTYVAQEQSSGFCSPLSVSNLSLNDDNQKATFSPLLKLKKQDSRV